MPTSPPPAPENVNRFSEFWQYVDLLCEYDEWEESAAEYLDQRRIPYTQDRRIIYSRALQFGWRPEALS